MVLTRNYQLNIFNTAKEKNTIAFLPTGTGKTHVAALLIKHYLELEDQKDKIIGFVAPTKVLLNQHWNTLKEACQNVTIRTYSQDSKLAECSADPLTPEFWYGEASRVRIMLFIPEILRQILEKRFLDPLKFSLIVIDECHNAFGTSSLSIICEKFRQVQTVRILGLTASPITSKEGNAVCSISELEAIMGSSLIYPQEHDDEIKEVLTPPNLSVVRYNENFLNFLPTRGGMIGVELIFSDFSRLCQHFRFANVVTLGSDSCCCPSTGKRIIKYRSQASEVLFHAYCRLRCSSVFAEICRLGYRYGAIDKSSIIESSLDVVAKLAVKQRQKMYDDNLLDTDDLVVEASVNLAMHLVPDEILDHKVIGFILSIEEECGLLCAVESFIYILKMKCTNSVNNNQEGHSNPFADEGIDELFEGSEKSNSRSVLDHIAVIEMNSLKHQAIILAELCPFVESSLGDNCGIQLSSIAEVFYSLISSFSPTHCYYVGRVLKSRCDSILKVCSAKGRSYQVAKISFEVVIQICIDLSKESTDKFSPVQMKCGEDDLVDFYGLKRLISDHWDESTRMSNIRSFGVLVALTCEQFLRDCPVFDQETESATIEKWFSLLSLVQQDLVCSENDVEVIESVSKENKLEDIDLSTFDLENVEGNNTLSLKNYYFHEGSALYKSDCLYCPLSGISRVVLISAKVVSLYQLLMKICPPSVDFMKRISGRNFSGFNQTKVDNGTITTGKKRRNEEVIENNDQELANAFTNNIELSVDPKLNDWSCIVFCKTKLLTLTLSRLLYRIKAYRVRVEKMPTNYELFLQELPCYFANLRPHFLNGDEKHKFQVKSLKNFDLGYYNILFSTTIAEEGIDIRKCQTVINFDYLHSTKSFIQRRGRARAANGRMITFVPNCPRGLKMEEQIKTFVRNEGEMQRIGADSSIRARRIKMLEENGIPEELLPNGEEEDNKSRVYIAPESGCVTLLIKSTGACCDTRSVAQQLQLFCQQNRFWYTFRLDETSLADGEKKKYNWKLELFPTLYFANYYFEHKDARHKKHFSLPFTDNKGYFWLESGFISDKRLAKSIVALKCFKLLYETGTLLDENLCSVGREKRRRLFTAKSSEMYDSKDGISGEYMKQENTYNFKVAADIICPSSAADTPSRKTKTVYFYGFVAAGYPCSECNLAASCSYCKFFAPNIVNNVGICFLNQLPDDILDIPLPVNYEFESSFLKLNYIGCKEITAYSAFCSESSGGLEEYEVLGVKLGEIGSDLHHIQRFHRAVSCWQSDFFAFPNFYFASEGSPWPESFAGNFPNCRVENNFTYRHVEDEVSWTKSSCGSWYSLFPRGEISLTDYGWSEFIKKCADEAQNLIRNILCCRLMLKYPFKADEDELSLIGKLDVGHSTPIKFEIEGTSIGSKALRLLPPALPMEGFQRKLSNCRSPWDGMIACKAVHEIYSCFDYHNPIFEDSVPEILSCVYFNSFMGKPNRRLPMEKLVIHELCGKSISEDVIRERLEEDEELSEDRLATLFQLAFQGEVPSKKIAKWSSFTSKEKAQFKANYCTFAEHALKGEKGSSAERKFILNNMDCEMLGARILTGNFSTFLNYSTVKRDKSTIAASDKSHSHWSIFLFPHHARLLGPAKYYYAGMLMPRILHRINGSLIAWELREKVSDMITSVNEDGIFIKPFSAEAYFSKFNKNDYSMCESVFPVKNTNCPELGKVLCAISPRKLEEEFDSEIFEFLGDNVLKLLVTLGIYRKYSKYDQGELSCVRSRLVSNHHLYMRSRHFEIFRYLRVIPVAKGSALYFKPPGIVEKLNFNIRNHPYFKEDCSVTMDFEEVNNSENVIYKYSVDTEDISDCYHTLWGKEISYRKSLSSEKKTSESIPILLNTFSEEGLCEEGIQFKSDVISRKCIADMMEALLGVYYLHGGISFANRLLKSIDGEIWVQDEEDVNMPMQLISFFGDEMDDDNHERDENIKAIREIFGYEFKNYNYLLEAITHSSTDGLRSAYRIGEGSMSNAKISSRSYERMEFLGDAVLDFAVVNYLFRQLPKHSNEGQFSYFKSKIVENSSLAADCLRTGLHKLMYTVDVKFREEFSCEREDISQEEYIRRMVCDNKVLFLVKPLADIVESVIGAIFVDCDLCLETAFDAIYKVIRIDEKFEKLLAEYNMRNSNNNEVVK